MLCIFTNNSFISFSKHFSAKLSITIKRKIKKKMYNALVFKLQSQQRNHNQSPAIPSPSLSRTT